MKTKLTFIVIIILFFAFTNRDNKNKGIVEPQRIDIINDDFAESKAEIQIVLDEILKSMQDKDANKLISYHVYGPKFTEFRDGGRRFGSAENEAFERGLIEAISAFDYKLDDQKINVFGDVAVVTFHADFRPTIDGEVHQIWESTTLVFVKVNGEWKITHEHHSPLITDKNLHNTGINISSGLIQIIKKLEDETFNNCTTAYIRTPKSFPGWQIS